MPGEELAAPRPFVKWVGGKGRLLPQLQPLLPPQVDRMRHLEPFVGGGALFFARRPALAVLSDINPDLIHAYQSIRDDVAGVIAALAPLAAAGHDSTTYYAVRARYNAGDGRGSPLRAALFIYLNKTCFNGLHRVNRRGEFNVPVGRYKNPGILDVAALRATSLALQHTELRCSGFEGLLEQAREGDFVFLDPPYASSFTGYASEGFSSDDQLRLRDGVGAMRERGVSIMLTNSDVPLVRQLYSDWHITPVRARRAVNASGAGRGAVTELVVRNYACH